MKKKTIQTTDAPQAIGTYSQGIRVSGGDTVYVSGQIGLDPLSMQMVNGIEEQIHRVFLNLKAVAAASGGSPRRYRQIECLSDRPFQFSKSKRNHGQLL